MYFDVKNSLLYVKKHYENEIETMVYRSLASGEVEKTDLDIKFPGQANLCTVHVVFQELVSCWAAALAPDLV